MALVLANRVRETTTTTGTGTVTLAGAVTGYQSFSVIGNANTTFYAIAGQGTSEWEVGIGTYTLSGTTLARTTILASSNAGSAVSFSAGTKDVFVTYPSNKSVNLDATGNLLLPSGTVSVPGAYFSTETSTGFYRIGANNTGFAISGTKLLDFSSALFAVTGAATVSTTLGVTGATTLSSTLGVTGAVTLAGATASAWTTYAPIQAALPAISGNTEFLLGSNVYYDGAFKYVGARTASSIILGSATGAAAKLITMNVTATTGSAGGAITFVEALSITKDGAVTIGAALTVSNNINVTASGTLYNLINLKDTVDQSGATFVQFLKAAGGNIGNITRNGATDAVLYNLTSDYRTKDIFGSLTTASDTLRKIRVYDGKRHGALHNEALVLAHEYAEILPWAVTGEKDGVDKSGEPQWQSVAVGSSENLLIAGWQDHESQIQSLLARIATLEAR